LSPSRKTEATFGCANSLCCRCSAHDLRRKIELHIEHLYELQEAQHVHSDLEGCKTTGKLLLIS
jgi:hypothetical protein